MDIKFLFHTDVSDLVTAINNISEEKWHEFTLRQQLFEVHQHTLTIPFKWSLISELPNQTTELFNSSYNYIKFPTELLASITKLSQELCSYWQNDNIANCILLKLLAGETIPTHADSGYMLESCKRCHCAIITHPDVCFTVGDTTIHMAPGDWYFINNMAPHSVANHSSIDRVHLVIDIA